LSEFIKEIIKARAELGLKRRQVERDIGIARGYQTEIETGKYNLSARYGVLLCSYYGIDIQLYLDYKQEMLLKEIEKAKEEVDVLLISNLRKVL
jgi:transcriptional regulator with XRE-family HTH domain